MDSLQDNILTLITESDGLPFSFAEIRNAHRQRFPDAPVPGENSLARAMKSLRDEGKISVEQRIGRKCFLVLQEQGHDR